MALNFEEEKNYCSWRRRHRSISQEETSYSWKKSMWWWWRRYIVVSLGKTSQILKGIHMLVMEMSRYWPLQRPEADKSWSYDDDLHCFGDHRCQVELSKWTLCWRRSWSSSKSDVVKCHLESPPEVRWPGRGGILAKLTFETIKEELHKHKVAKKDGLIMQPCFLSRIVAEYEEQANNLLYPATKPVALWHQTEMFARTKAKNRLPKGRLCFAHLLHCEEPSMGPLMPKDQETKLNFFVKLDNPDS